MASRRRDRGDGALFEDRTSGRWVGRIVVDGHRHKVTAKTKTEAGNKLRALRRQADAGLPVAPGDLTVATLLDDWSRKALPNRNLEPATLTMHRANISVMTDDALGRQHVRTLTPEHVEAFLARRAKLGRARRTLAGYRTTLRMALGWAERRGVVARNVAAVVELPAEARKAKPGRTMTAEQARAFLTAAEGTPLEAMFVTMTYLGLRPGEAAGLSWDDVDEANRIVHVRQGRKVDERGAAVVGKLKTTYSTRSLNAPPAVVKALRAHRKRQARERLAAGEFWANPDDLVFTSPTGRPTSPTQVRDEFLRVIERAGLGDGWTPNHLRHTAASLMADAGVPIEEVADQLGHRDTRMASLHYRHRIKPTVSGGTVLGTVLDG
jgi:integrase